MSTLSARAIWNSTKNLRPWPLAKTNRLLYKAKEGGPKELRAWSLGLLIKDSGIPWTTTTPIRPISVGYDMELHVAITFLSKHLISYLTIQTTTMLILISVCYYLEYAVL